MLKDGGVRGLGGEECELALGAAERLGVQRLAPRAVRADECVDAGEEHDVRRDRRAVPERVADLREHADGAMRLDVVVRRERRCARHEGEVHDVL